MNKKQRIGLQLSYNTFSNSSTPLTQFTVSKLDNLEYERQCKPVVTFLKPCRGSLEYRDDLQTDLFYFPSTDKSVLATPKRPADVCVTQSYESALLDTS